MRCPALSPGEQSADFVRALTSSDVPGDAARVVRGMVLAVSGDAPADVIGLCGSRPLRPSRGRAAESMVIRGLPHRYVRPRRFGCDIAKDPHGSYSRSRCRPGHPEKKSTETATYRVLFRSRLFCRGSSRAAAKKVAIRESKASNMLRA